MIMFQQTTKYKKHGDHKLIRNGFHGLINGIGFLRNGLYHFGQYVLYGSYLLYTSGTDEETL